MGPVGRLVRIAVPETTMAALSCVVGHLSRFSICRLRATSRFFRNSVDVCVWHQLDDDAWVTIAVVTHHVRQELATENAARDKKAGGAHLQDAEATTRVAAKHARGVHRRDYDGVARRPAWAS